MKSIFAAILALTSAAALPLPPSAGAAAPGIGGAGSCDSWHSREWRQAIQDNVYYSATLVAKYLKDVIHETGTYQEYVLNKRLASKQVPSGSEVISQLAKWCNLTLQSGADDPLVITERLFYNTAILAFLTERIRDEEMEVEFVQGVHEFAAQLSTIRELLISSLLHLHNLLHALDQKLTYAHLEAFRLQFKKIEAIVHKDREFRYLRDYLVSGVILKAADHALSDILVLRHCSRI